MTKQRRIAKHMVHNCREQLTLKPNLIVPEIQCHSCQLEEIHTVPTLEGDNLEI